MANRYQLARQEVKNIMSEIVHTEEVRTDVSMLNRIRTATSISQWFRSGNDASLREQAISYVNFYSLGRNVKALTDCILNQAFAIENLPDGNTKDDAYKALENRIFPMIQAFMRAITEDDLNNLIANGGLDSSYINDYPKIKKTQRVKYEKPRILKVSNPAGIEDNGIAHVHKCTRESCRGNIQVILEVSENGPRILRYERK